MGLSSNSIIHFTSKCRDLLVPILSFCDTPFYQIKDHIKSYGNYGIGLSKKWAEENGLNPVLYLEKNSTLSENVLNELYFKIKGESENIDQLSVKDKQAFDVLRYIKNYQGDLNRTGKKTLKNYRFSDEREWRYVMDTNSEHNFFGMIPPKITEVKISKVKNSLNKKITNQKLKFKPEDISYITIKNENQRDGLIQLLEKVNGKHAHDAVKRLTSRIISTEQLITDF
jgi:hypothetical protein